MKRIQKILLIGLLTLLAGSAYSQKKASDRKGDKSGEETSEWSYSDDLEDEEDEVAEQQGASEAQWNTARYDTADNATSTKDEAEMQASIQSAELASNFDIRDTKKRKELQKACLKFYRARALLLQEYPDSTSREYTRRFRILDREYARELQKVLPQS